DQASPITSFIASVLLIVGLLPILFTAAKTMLSLVGNGTLFSFSVFAICGLLIGHFLGGPEPENRRVLALAAATRHPAIAVAIAHANFPDQKLAVPAVFLYTIVGAILSGLYFRLTSHKKTSQAGTSKQVVA